VNRNRVDSSWIVHQLDGIWSMERELNHALATGAETSITFLHRRVVILNLWVDLLDRALDQA